VNINHFKRGRLTEKTYVRQAGSPVKCGCADADVESVKSGKILRGVSVDVMGKVRVRLGLRSDLGFG